MDSIQSCEMGNALSEKQNGHLEYIVETAQEMLREKYVKGALEHKTDLKDDHSVEQIVDFALEEALDQLTYLLTLKQKLIEEKAAKKDVKTTEARE